MDKIRLAQNADFLDIALESIEAGASDVATDFIADVADELDGNRKETLVEAQEHLDVGEVDEAISCVETVYAELVAELDAIR